MDAGRLGRIESLKGLFVSVTAAILAGCTSLALEPLEPDPALSSSSAPEWSAQPLSWSKLEDIERWLEGFGPERTPEAVPEAELELAEGRVALAIRETAAVPASVLDVRLDLAEAGFQRVLASPYAGAADRRRAQVGLERVGDLRPTAVARGGLPAIRSRASWGARAPILGRLRPNARSWSRVTVHHSASVARACGGPSAAPAADAIRRIQSAHMGTEGWGDIGYHFLIDPAGRLYQGREMVWQGAHAGGTNNVANIGICLLGNFNEESPDPRALTTLRVLLDALTSRHGIRHAAVKCHRDFKATECPGKNLVPWVQRYASDRLAHANMSAPTDSPRQ